MHAFTALYPLTVSKHGSRRFSTVSACVQRGPSTPQPDYSVLDGQLHNRAFMAAFQKALDRELTHSGGQLLSENSGYERVSGSVERLAQVHVARDALEDASLRVLRALLPEWLPKVFYRVFVIPMPVLAARLCALVTVSTTQWLMGPSKISEDDGGTVEIERCRYLEEAGCVGICVHSCKFPTQQYFEEDMRFPLHVEPDLRDYSCKFKFGVKPPNREEDEMMKEGCFTECGLRLQAGSGPLDTSATRMGCRNTTALSSKMRMDN